MTNQLINKFKALPKKERKAYFLIALATLIIISVVSYGPASGRQLSTGKKLSAWCGEAKDNIHHYTADGLTCGLYRNDELILLGDAETIYNTFYCELYCYDCSTEDSVKAQEICAASSSYVRKPSDTPSIDEVTDLPPYGETDGEDAFILNWESVPDTAYRNEKAAITIKVSNPDMVTGKMKVQCSMLDPAVHTWMYAVSGINIQNCVRGEAFTATKIVSLGPKETARVKFEPYAPNEVGDYEWWCVAFERCYDEGADAGVSSTLKGKMIAVEQRPAYSPIVDSDSVMEDLENGDGTEPLFDWKIENPFKDLKSWWAPKNTLQKFLIIFSVAFVVILIIFYIGGRNQQTR